MTNYFGFNFITPFGMNNWFMPVWSFSNPFMQFQMPSFNIFNNTFTPFNFNSYTPQLFQTSVFQPSYYSPFLFSTNKSKKEDKTDDNKKSTEKNNDAKKSSKTNTDTFTRSSSINYASDNLKLDGYNAFKGERLASVALSRSVGWTGYCARFVKTDIQEAGLGSYQYGHAYQMPSILKNNKNFKEISTEGVDVSKLPAGCVLVYDRGSQGYSSKYGHTEITTGDGRAVSDGVTRHLYKKPSSIFVPV